MAFYLAALIHALVPAALIIALWPMAIANGADVRRSGAGMGAAVGMVAGALAILFALARAAETATGTALQVAAFVAALTALAILGLARFIGRRPAAVFTPVLIAILAAQGVFAAWNAMRTHTLTATGVVNTQLIVNCTAILFGVAALTTLVLVLTRVAGTARGRVPTLVLIGVLVLALVAGSGQVILGLLRLESITVTAGRISYVARISLVEPWLVYADLGFALVIAVIAFRRRFRAGAVPDRVERRLQIAHALSDARWRNALGGLLAFLLIVLAYQDLYASRPPTLSPAEPAHADAHDEIRIPVDTVKDGKLHRYAYVTSAGHRVRFFLLNRYDETHVDIGVVFDACMICGDAGYIQNGDEIICVACNVRMFRPSIGKPGGCNPIPLPHTLDNGVIVITGSALEKGARHFPEVVDVDVTDPVTGEHLVNRKAPFQYEFNGRTYFFGGKDSYEKFHAAPESFTGGGEHG